MTLADPEDLTARARIRDAAMLHFGEHGFDRATIRGIAETAGVSSGLVRHHFGSKQALRDACDAHLVKVVTRLNDQLRTEDLAKVANPVAAARGSMGPFHKYLTRALVDGGATALFDAMVDIGAQWFASADESRPDPPGVDPRSRATVFTAMVLAITVLQPHVSRGLGVDVQSAAGDQLLARILIDLYSHPILGADDAASALSALDDLPEQESP